MTTSPRMLSVDRGDLAIIRDLSIARVADLTFHQHALMTSFGGPAQSRSVYWYADSGTAATRVCSIRVPPGVTDVALALLTTGNGTIVITAPGVDDVGVRMIVAVETEDAGTMQTARYVRTGDANPVESGNSIGSGRALTVRSSVVWEFSDVGISVTIDPHAGLKVVVWELVVYPIHVPR